MGLLFIHGVTARSGDPETMESTVRRSTLFKTHVVQPLREYFPDFCLFHDAYWGDAGVQFRNPPESFLATRDFELDLTDQEIANNSALAYYLIQIACDVGDSVADFVKADIQSFDDLLTRAAKNSPDELIRAIISQERDRLALIRDFDEIGNLPNDAGHLSARLLDASTKLVKDEETLERLRNVENGQQVQTIIADAIKQFFEEELEEHGEADKPDYGMGPKTRWVSRVVNSMWQGTWGVGEATYRRIRGLVKSGALDVATAGVEVGSPLLSKLARRHAGPGAMLFFGDVFEYLRRGQGDAENLGPISGAVLNRLTESSQASKDRGEPFVVVTHSFGSMIFYDLITSVKEAQNIEFDVWAMAGSQVSMFAAMNLFIKPITSVAVDEREEKKDPPALGKPEKVRKWLNFYHPSDMFSYRAEPIFGPDTIVVSENGTDKKKTTSGVEDVVLDGNVSIHAAHSSYFDDPRFYQRIYGEIANPFQEAKESTK
jgi:hypothetical protein